MKLEGKVAIVAGGGQGIGEGIVKCLAEEGADVAVVDINPATAKQRVEEVKSLGRKGLALALDLTEEEQANKAVKDTVDFFSKVDILVNDVGGVAESTGMAMAQWAASQGELARQVLYMRYNGDIWDKFYQLNLKSHVMLTNAVTPYFVNQRSGRIVNVSSVAGRNADPNQMPYAAMKAADISITWSTARALAPYSVTVNCICPGFVYTPLWERGATGYLAQTRQAVEEARKNGQPVPVRFAGVDLDNITPREYWLRFIVIPATPNGREQTAEDMGKAVVFFCSEDAKNVTGQVLHVDGGMTMR